MKILDHLWNAFSLTLNIVLTLFLPIILICLILNIISSEQNKRLLAMAGWRGLLATAWIGTPIHEISHALAALISGHKIRELKLFKPNPHTGTLGYITHTFDPHNFYQAIIGNTIIAIAPFFGGALTIYLALYFLLPQFSLYSSEVPRVSYVTFHNIFVWKSYLLFGETILDFYRYLVLTIYQSALLSDWKFYGVSFVLFGIANHLSPSSSDFKNFWQPLAVILFFMTVFNLIVLPFTKKSLITIDVIAHKIFLIMPILLLAVLISAVGLLLTYLLYIMTALFRR